MENRYVFCWTWPDRKTAYVWHDTARDSADILWRERFAYECQLNDFLRTIEVQPELDKASSLSWPLHGTEARTAARTIKDQLKQQGFKVLSGRDRASIKINDGESRPVYVKNAWAENGWSWYPSVRAAARALGLDQSAVTLAAQKGRTVLYQSDVDSVLD